MNDEISRIAAFLADLDALTEKHGIAIGGCGCCKSPFLEDKGCSMSLRYGDLEYGDGGYMVVGCDLNLNRTYITKDGKVDEPW